MGEDREMKRTQLFLNAIKLGGVLHIKITCRALKTINHSLRGGAQVILVSIQGGKLGVSRG